ncbi:NADPH-dependent FMN reductase [Chitinophagaceae bacterium MMS25-I14]
MNKVRPVHILAISGSLRSASVNTTIINALQAIAPEHISVTIYEGIGNLPHFMPGTENDAAPQSVHEWRAALKQADAVVFSTPEYAGGVPGVLKNALDWIVSSGELVEKPVAVISASPFGAGGAHANASLVLTLGFVAAIIPEACKICIGGAPAKIAAPDSITDEATLQQLRTMLQVLADMKTGEASAPPVS